MTCVVASTWNPFSASNSWYSMNPDPSDPSNSGLERAQSHGYASSGSEARRSGTTSKKRASRAGTRSVNTLSAAQLERKRANDREAQRAIRQRTKDHIDHLERNLEELRQSQDASEKLVVATRQRNRELEEENSFLRLRLSEAGLAVNVPASEASRAQDSKMASTHASSPATQPTGLNIQRPGSTSTSRSFPPANAQATSSRSGSWQHPHQQPGYGGSHPMPLAIPGGASVGSVQGLTTWRSHESTQSLSSSVPGEVQTPAQHQASLAYSTPAHVDRSQWSAATPQYHYAVPEQQQPSHYQQPYAPSAAQPQPQQQTSFAHPPLQTFPGTHQPQSAGYHPPQLPPQSEFQNLSVSSPAGYHMPSASQTFVPPTQYQTAPVPTSEYRQPHGQMQPASMPAAPYHPATGEMQYPPSQQHPPVQYRDDSGRGYNMAHYPSS